MEPCQSGCSALSGWHPGLRGLSRRGGFLGWTWRGALVELGVNQLNKPGYGISPLQYAGQAFRFRRRTHQIKKRPQPLNDLAAQKIEWFAGFEQEDRRRLQSPAHNGVGHFLQKLKILRGERCGGRASGKRMRHRTPKTVPEQSTKHTPPYGKFGRVGQSRSLYNPLGTDTGTLLSDIRWCYADAVKRAYSLKRIWR